MRDPVGQRGKFVLVLSQGHRLGRYRIEALIGAGGMGEVYRATDTVLAREVAIKILPAQFATDPQRLARFAQEAKAVAALDHPNIVVLHDFLTESGTAFTVSELLEGQPLRAHLPEQGVPWAKTLEIASGIVDGLAAAHQRGVVHRDLKPENIFVTAEGRVKILDFGLARVRAEVDAGFSGATHASETPTLTQAGVPLGTVGYMAPEQVRGEAADARSDIFALGCLFYEMLTGQRPFGGRTAGTVMAAILHEEPQPLQVMVSSVPARIVRLVQRCLEKDPARRFQTAADLRYALKEVAKESSESVSIAVQARSRPRINPWLVLGVVAVLAVGALSWRRFQPQDTEPSTTSGEIKSIAVLPLQSLSPEADQGYFAAGMTSELIMQLAKIRTLRVVPFASVMSLKQSTNSLHAIGDQLRVDGIIVGQVLKVGEQVRISTELVHSSSGQLVWTESYQRDYGDILVLQSEIARTIARQIQISLTPREKALLEAKPVNAKAYDLCLRGDSQFQRYDREGFARAREYYEAAIAEDPEFALAYICMANYYGAQVYWGFMAPSNGVERVHTLTGEALRRDPTLPQIGSISGNSLYFLRWDWAGAEEAYLDVVRMQSPHEPPPMSYAMLLAGQGRFDEANQLAQRTMDLDPLNVSQLSIYGYLLAWEGDDEGAIAALERVPEMFPSAFSLWGLYWNRGDLPAAYHACRNVMQQRSELEPLLAPVDEIWSHPEDAVETRYAAAMKRVAIDLIARRQAGEFVAATMIAKFSLHAGETESAMDWLETAVQERDPQMVHLNDGLWRSLYGEPRFQAIAQDMKLPLFPR